MKNLLAIAVLSLIGVASAEPGFLSSAALGGKTICSDPKIKYVSLSDNAGKFLPASFAADLERQVTNKLVAYRVKTGTNCAAPDSRYLDINIQMTDSTSTMKAFVVMVSAQHLDPGKYFTVITWQDFTFGYSQRSASETGTAITQAVLSLVDTFAADYARANP